MCGLRFVKSKRYRQMNFDKALAKMHHRGPDATVSTIVDDVWYLGHQRLKVVDLAKRSDQPMWDLSQRYAILFNGEIYNLDRKSTRLNSSHHSISYAVFCL